MKYIIKSGSLCYVNNMMPIYKIKGDISSFNRNIFDCDDNLMYQIEVKEKKDNFLKRSYNILDNTSCKIGYCEPNYPNKSHINQIYNDLQEAHITLEDEEYTIKMVNQTKYYVLDEDKHRLLKINHRGIDGGWEIDEKDDIDRSQICIFFVLCRYLEREKENLFIK